MNCTDRVSVILPVYNCKGYVRDCIVSIIRQTHKNYEVIVVDDGSTDDTITEIKKIVGSDNRFIYICRKKKGVSAARNTGLEIASGEYIYFVDADDKIREDLFERALDTINKKGCDIFCFNYYIWFDQHNKEKIASSSKTSQFLDNESFLKMIYSTRGAYEKCACGGYVWNKFIRRRVIGNVRFTEETSAAEDEFFSFDVIQSTSAKVYYDCTPLYWYRQRDGSLVKTSKFSFKHLDTRIKMFSRCYSNDNHKVILATACLQSLISCIIEFVKSPFSVTNYDLLELKLAWSRLRSKLMCAEKRAAFRELNSHYKKYFFLIILLHFPLSVFCLLRHILVWIPFEKIRNIVTKQGT